MKVRTQPFDCAPTSGAKFLELIRNGIFVVLNIGLDQGVLEDGELLVSRKQAGCQVIVRSVEKNPASPTHAGLELGEVLKA